MAVLSDTHPDLAIQAHGWDPTRVAVNSNQKLAWRCEQGHVWDAIVFSRTNAGNGCPFCGNRKVLAGYNDLATTHPLIAAEAKGWDPTSVIAGSARRMRWRCELGHEYESTPASRIRGTRCPVCTNRRVLAGYNDLATTHPDLSAQADGWDPTTLVAGSKARKQWRCEAGHAWTASVSERARRNSGCPRCANRSDPRRQGRLDVANPEVAAQAHGWDPSTLTAGSSQKRSWRCAYGHVWEARVNHRTRGTDCPVCTKRVIIPGVNDLATTHPALAAQAIGWDPRLLGSGTPQKKLWRCELGHDWTARVDVRAAGAGCPFCSHHRLMPGLNDLATTHPELAAQAHDWDPTTCMAGSNEKRHWRCDAGHEWDAIVASRAAGNNCAVCSGRTLLKGYNDLATRYPDLAAEADGWDPTSLVAGSKKKAAWCCAAGHHWTATVSSRTRANAAGCPTCAGYGFSSAEPAWLYLFEHPTWGLLQIGITNAPETRLSKHEKAGWVLLDVRGPMNGDMTRSWEAAILTTLRHRGVVHDENTSGGRFDGYTESWPRASLKVTTLRELMDLVEAQETQAETRPS